MMSKQLELFPETHWQEVKVDGKIWLKHEKKY